MQVFFNRPNKPWPRQVLMRDLRQARASIIIASAWFTDMDIVEAVLTPKKFLKKKIFFNCADLQRDGAGQVYEEFCRQKDSWTTIKVLGTGDWREGVMHHKFIIIDEAILWTGSYNFTYQARKNYESILRIRDADVVEQFVEEVRVLEEEPENGLTGYACSYCESQKNPIVYYDSHGTMICNKCQEAESALKRNLQNLPAVPVAITTAMKTIPGYPIRELSFTCVGCWTDFPREELNFMDSNGPRCGGCSGGL